MLDFLSDEVATVSDAAFVVLISFLIVATIWIVVTAVWYYADGRATGGYPVFAKFRKHYNLNTWVYNIGKRQSQKKISKGGYK